jgi:hypothetical protein
LNANLEQQPHDVRRGRKWVTQWTVVVLLLWRVSRAGAQEDQAGFRQEWYQEDDDRVRVNTQSFLFDVGLSSKVRLNGNVVLDAISGATPVGAPARTEWVYPTYDQYYASAYDQAYDSLYTDFVNENQILVDTGYITQEQLDAAAKATASAGAPAVATDSATTTYQSLTNNPNYRSSQVPLTTLEDRRTAFGLGLPITIDRHLVSPSFSYSEESDYVSYGGALNYSLALNQKNTTLNFGWSHNADSVRDDLGVWQDKTVDAFLIGVVQLISPRAYFTVNFSYNNEDGYLTDPYRGVMVEPLTFEELQKNPDDPATDPEKRPDHRDRQVLYATYNQFVTPLNGAAELIYRFSNDSWEIAAHTVDVRWHQKIGPKLVISPSFRYYNQTAADFYYPGLVPNPLPENYSSDYRLSEMQTFTYGLRVTWRVHEHASLDAGYQRYIMEGLDDTSPSAYPSANVISVGVRLWF